FTFTVQDAFGNTNTSTITISIKDDVPQILSIQNAVMPNVADTDAHGTWQPVFGADGPSATAAIGVAMGTAPSGETYSITNNVGTSATGEQINLVTVTPTTGTAYTFYEYTHYNAATHSSEMLAYQTLAGAQSGQASNEFFTLTMAADGTYDFHLATNQLQTTTTFNGSSIPPGSNYYVDVAGTSITNGQHANDPVPTSGYDILIQGGTNYVVATGGFMQGTVNSSQNSFGVNNAHFNPGEVVDFKFGTPQLSASFSIATPPAGESFQVYIWNSAHTAYLTEMLTGNNVGTFTVDAAHWTGTGVNDLAHFNAFVAANGGGFSEMDVVNNGVTVDLTSIKYNEQVTVADTALTFAPTITDGDGDVASSGSNLTVSLIGSHTGYQLSGANAVLVASASGHDTFTGNGTNDTVDFSNAASSVQVNLLTHTYSGAATGDTLTGIENLIGSSHDDVLVGDANNNILTGGGGTNTMTGGAGADTFKIDHLDIKDIITDFHGAGPGGEGDQIDLTALFDKADNVALSNYVQYNSANGTLSVDSTGLGSNFVVVAELQNGPPATGTINILYDDSNHHQQHVTI
ncbi:type I secretion C-terminal target domain-containing protein, partial [Mesorhizobium sp. B2-8-3]|uniref:type I secretion C-terminal target domain-containing protein n=1 Tax=Mesorhizobium sp. B2-8-3 TaxID=2589905 RepID=UPI00112AF169